VGDKAAERRAIGQQDREVVETEQSALWNGSRGAQLAKADDLPILAVRSEPG